MSASPPLLIEGLTPDEILALPDEHLDALVLTDTPLTFRAGTAEILGQFCVQSRRLTVQLAHIEGGGEGVLLALFLLAERLARRRGLEGVEWVVHALRCAAPNPKLRHVLELRGFAIRDVPGVGQAYYLFQPLQP